MRHSWKAVCCSVLRRKVLANFTSIVDYYSPREKDARVLRAVLLWTRLGVAANSKLSAALAVPEYHELGPTPPLTRSPPSAH